MSKLETNTIDNVSGSTTLTIGDSNASTISIPKNITLGASGTTITVPAGATITNNGTQTGFGGITEIDVWYLDTGISVAAGTLTLVTGLVNNTAFSFTKLGIGMSHSSGIFSFPSTGYYEIEWKVGSRKNSASRSVESRIYTTLNNSTYNQVSIGFSNIYGAGTSTYTTTTAKYIFKVTDISNCKLKPYVQSDAGLDSLLSGTDLAVQLIFKKLAGI